MKLYVDLETLQLIEGPGFRNPVTTLRFKRGDAARLDVTFLANGTTAIEIGDPSSLELRFGVKPRDRYDVAYLVHSSAWTLPEVGAETPLYQCSPSFNTVELDSAMQVGSAAGSELSEITLMGEITWREGAGEPTSTRTFLVVVENDVNRGTEGVPTEAEPAYPAPEQILLLSNSDWLASKAVRYDAPQAPLDQTARDQFMANFGATLAEELPGPALRAVQLLDGSDNPWLTYDGMDANFAAYTLIASAFAGTSIWDTSIGEEVINLSSKQLMQSGFPVLDWSGSTLAVGFPDLTVPRVATDTLMNSSYASIIDIANRQLLGSGASPILEWDDTYAYFTGDLAVSGGFYGGILYDETNGTPSVDLTNRQLLGASSQFVIDWSGSDIYLNGNMISGPYSFISDVFACYNGGAYLYGISDTIDLSTATSITVSGGIITGYA